MGIEIQPQSRRRFLRSGLQLPAQKAADDIYLWPSGTVEPQVISRCSP
nr:MAG TPA: hypothetical protein [Caudoviricetes sp.]